VASGGDSGECPPPSPPGGSTSLADLFQHFRWDYEFLFAESVERLIAWKDGGLDREGTRRWLALRSEAGALEMDSASFNLRRKIRRDWRA
jgi:hypothetical protein